MSAGRVHPRLEELLEYLASSRAVLTDAIIAVAESKRDSAPSPGRWSVAAVLEHLGIVERRVTHLLTQQVSAARAEGAKAEESVAPILPTINLGRMVDRSHRIATGEATTPRAELPWAEAWANLAKTREQLTAAIRDADGLALGERVAPHPALGPINLYEWIAFVGAHERRHAEQIRELAPPPRI